MSTSPERITLIEAIEKQNRIIRIQSEVIDSLFQIAAQHISAEEVEALPEIDKIQEAITLRKEVEP